MESLIFMAVGTGIVAFAVFVIRMHRRQQAELKVALTQAGFQPLPQLDSELEQSLKDLSGWRKITRSKVTNVHKYSGLNYDLYRYDIPGNDNKETRYAMDFRQYIFPSFAAIPNIKLPGFLGSAVNKLLQLATSRMEFKEVEVPGKPRFKERYRLYGADPRQLLSTIEAHVWDRLADLQGNLCLSGQGRVLVLTAMIPTQGRRYHDPVKDLRITVETADALWHVFNEVRPARAAAKVGSTSTF